MTLPFTLRVDDEGDTLVTCCSEKCEIDLGILQVSSKAVTLASPVFQAMLNPSRGFKESQIAEDGIRHIRLITDDFNLTTIVMNIIHHKNSRNPDSISLEELYRLTDICDYYQVQEAIGPAVCNWVNHLWPLEKELRDCARWLWIAKVFKLENVFKECVQTSVFHIRMTSTMLYTIDEVSLHSAMNEFARDVLWKRREKLVSRLIENSEAKVRTYQESLSKNQNVCKEDGATACECDITQLGSLLSLKLLIGYPEANLDDFSLMEVCDIYKNIRSY
ncbi:hypothetical protein TWF703_004625, partial [Orbilia oligospora]